MSEAFFLLLGSTLGLGFSILHERIKRLRSFRDEMSVMLVRLKRAEHSESFHAATRDAVLTECAKIRPDIFYNRKTEFDSAATAYQDAVNDAWLDVVKNLFPRSEARERISPTRERMISALAVLIDCTRWLPE